MGWSVTGAASLWVLEGRGSLLCSCSPPCVPVSCTSERAAKGGQYTLLTSRVARVACRGAGLDSAAAATGRVAWCRAVRALRFWCPLYTGGTLGGVGRPARSARAAEGPILPATRMEVGELVHLLSEPPEVWRGT